MWLIHLHTLLFTTFLKSCNARENDDDPEKSLTADWLQSGLPSQELPVLPTFRSGTPQSESSAFLGNIEEIRVQNRNHSAYFAWLGLVTSVWIAEWLIKSLLTLQPAEFYWPRILEHGL